jgi:uncharacterized protein
LGKIMLDATARKRLPNTVADVTLAIELVGRTSDEVSAALAQRSQTLLAYLREQNVDRLRTQGVSIAPRTETVHGEPDRIVGFNGQTFVSFRTASDKLGELLAGSLQHGGNTVTQTELSPPQSEVDAARRDLAIEATKSALQRAGAIAQTIGERVVRIESVNVEPEEEIQPLRYQPRAEGPASPAPAAIPIAAGEQELAVRVSVEVAIDRNVQ